MSVCLGLVAALNYATTQLEAMHALATLDTHLIQVTAMHVMVSTLFVFKNCDGQCHFWYCYNANPPPIKVLHIMMQRDLFISTS